MACVMRRILAAVVGSVAFATPAVAQSPVPAVTVLPSPAASALPDIGRTRARVLCTALREVVGPAILSTQHADVQFSDARTLVYDATVGPASGRGMLIRKIDRAVVIMAQDVMKLKALLDDPRLVFDENNTGTGVEKARSDVRVAVRALYESELRQLNALDAFLQTGRRLDMQTADEDMQMTMAALDGIVVPSKSAPSESTVGNTIAGHQSPYFGGPPHYTNKLAEANETDRWFGLVIKITTQREETASKVIVAVASLCR